MSLIVQVQQGKLQGKETTSSLSGKKFCTFLGIPYAKPPIGDLRFRAPEPVDKWQGVYDATFERNICAQKDQFTTGDILGSEDCLYLNVSVPEDPRLIKTPKAVMVFFHGGAYSFGSGSEKFYSADYFIDQDVILVTLNHRLHVLGFLNLGIPECPGNAGLKDQALALKWIKDNIKQFGGDADNVTIFGESSGASSVHFFMLSPLTKGLFNKAIIQSGSALAPWSLTYDYEEPSRIFGQKLNFPGGNAHEFLAFLKTRDVAELTKVAYEMRFELQKRYPGRATATPFTPTIETIEEGALLNEPPEKLLENAHPIPVIYGVTDKEGILICKLATENLVALLKTDFSILLKNNFKIDPSLIPDLSDKVKQYYFGDKEVSYGEELFNLYTDLLFYRFYDAIEKQTKSSSPPFIYEFGYDGGLNLFKKAIVSRIHPGAKGACHADENAYLFPMKVLRRGLPVAGDDLTVVQNITSLWANFAKTGIPKSDWRASTFDKPCYLRIDRELNLVDGKVYGNRLQFLRDLLDPVIESHIIS